MKPRLPDPSSPIAPHIVAFVGHKRALNRRYHVEDKVLRMFDGYLNTAGIMTLAEITPAVLDAFFLSRRRTRPRSFNHLVGVVGRLFEWMVEHGIVDRSPVTMRLRRRGQLRPPCILDLPTAQRLVDLAAQLPDRNNAPLRGPAYSTIFSLLFGLGLRVGEVARLRWRDVDHDRDVLIIRETKFSKSRTPSHRAAPGRTPLRVHGQKIGADVQLVARHADILVHGLPAGEPRHDQHRIPFAGLAAEHRDPGGRDPTACSRPAP